MATGNSNAIHEEFFEYNELIWGDLIYGTKPLLQKIGIGAGSKFPGEEGGPKMTLNTLDPRGFKCVVKEASYRGPGIFSASINFPGREKLWGLSDWEFFAPGVQRKVMVWADEFKGSAQDLVAAGLVPAGCFPGLPSMRKAVVTILPDGSLSQGAPNSNSSRSERGPGTREVTRISTTQYKVAITISSWLREQRLEASDRADAEWESRMNSLHRPPRIDGPLRAERNQAANTRQSSLRLVWSKPGFVPGFNSLTLGPFAR